MSLLTRAARKLAAFNRYMAEDVGGGPRPLKFAWVINVQKGGTLPFVLGLMWYFDNWSLDAWVYAALHGSYGLVWLLKHVALPDPNWERRVTFGGALTSWAMVLGPYWIAPFLLVSGILGDARTAASPGQIALALGLNALGVVIMMVADAQKYFTLRVRRGLITDGMFRYIRHPNYLGEMMLYAGFAVLVGHWIPWLVLAWVWLFLFVPNMLNKEASMSRYPEWAAYRARTGLLLPWLFR